MIISENLEQRIKSLKDKFDKIDCTQDFQQKLDPLQKEQRLEEQNILDLLEIMGKIIDKFHEQIQNQQYQFNNEGQQKQIQENQIINKNNEGTQAQQKINDDQLININDRNIENEEQNDNQNQQKISNDQLINIDDQNNENEEQNDNQNKTLNKQDHKDEKQQLIQIPPERSKELEESLKKFKDDFISLQNQQQQDNLQNQNQNLRFIYEALRETICYLQELYKKNEMIKNNKNQEEIQQLNQLDQFYQYEIGQNSQTNNSFFKDKIEEYLSKIKQFFQSYRKLYQNKIKTTTNETTQKELQKIYETFKNEEKYFNGLSQNLVTLQNNLKLKQFNEMNIEKNRKQFEQNCDELVKNIRKHFIEAGQQEIIQKQCLFNCMVTENVDFQSKEFQNISQRVFNYLNLQFLQCVIDQKISEINQKQCNYGQIIHLYDEIKQISPWNKICMEDLIQKLEKQQQIQDFNTQFEYKKILECIITVIKKNQLV